MAFSLPSLPSLPNRAPGLSLVPSAVLNAVSLIARNLPNVNPPVPIYAIVNAETGIPLTVPDSWGEITDRKDWQVSDYPIEDGGFAPYNKVQRPQTFEIVLVKTGSDLARASWLEAIRQQMRAAPLARYHIITPQGLYQSFTITRIAKQVRPDRGSNMLYLELHFTEVPQIEAPSLLGDRVVQPTSGPLANLGRVFSTVTPSPVAAIARTGAALGIRGA